MRIDEAAWFPPISGDESCVPSVHTRLQCDGESLSANSRNMHPKSSFNCSNGPTRFLSKLTPIDWRHWSNALSTRVDVRYTLFGVSACGPNCTQYDGFFRTVMENGIKGTREKDVSHYCIRMISANDNGQLGKYFVDSFIVEFGLMGSKWSRFIVLLYVAMILLNPTYKNGMKVDLFNLINQTIDWANE